MTFTSALHWIWYSDHDSTWLINNMVYLTVTSLTLTWLEALKTIVMIGGATFFKIFTHMSENPDNFSAYIGNLCFFLTPYNYYLYASRVCCSNQKVKLINNFVSFANEFINLIPATFKTSCHLKNYFWSAVFLELNLTSFTLLRVSLYLSQVNTE